MRVDPATSQYAATVAQVVPVVLFTALTVEFLVARRGAGPEDEALGSRRRRVNAFGDLLLSGAAVGLAFLTEFVALFGVRRGALTATDTEIMSWLLFVTFVVSMVRILLPLAQRHHLATGIPVGRSLAITGVVIFAVFVALFAVLVYLE